jgi:uracil-DNA glycosylase family 4
MSSFLSQQAPVNLRNASDLALLHQMECRACPLNNTVDGKMAPTGAERPLIYVLGEGPGESEIDEQEQFVGESGQLLRAHIPRRFKDHIRFNNVVRSRPPSNATPDRIEIECCRPSVRADIERSKPKVILGFGNVPLEWVSGFNGVTLWRGRRMPVKVGSHTCWYYPMLHPSYLLRQRRNDGVGSEEERMFKFDMKRAFDEVETLPKPIVHSVADVRHGVEIITDGGTRGVEQVAEALDWAVNKPVVGIDYETNGLRAMAAGAKILSAAIATGERAVAFPFDHPESHWGKEERFEVGELWKKFIREAKGVKAVHNLSFEMEWTGTHFGQDLIRAGEWGDTATQACILDERKGKQKPGCFSLEFLVQQYFGFNLKKLAGVDRKNLSETPIEAVLQYNAPDAKYHCLLWEKQAIEIKKEGLEEAAALGLRRVPACVLAQLKGLPVDQKEVHRLQIKYAGLLDDVVRKIMALPIIKEYRQRRGKDFKPLSNPDVLYVLKDMLNRSEILVLDKYTKKRHYSADESVLEQIEHPLAKLLLDLRKFNKRKATYIDPLAIGSPVLYPDGLLHAQFNTIFSEAGRISIEGPSLQNFPKRDNDAKEVRKSIAAPPGCVGLAFDYGQIEARILAAFTKDKQFCKALWERYDVHFEWAERIARAYPARVGGKKNLSDKKIMKDFRTDIKNQWTFPLFYGARMESAAGYLNIPPNIVKPLYDEFWRQFSGVRDWQEQQLEFYHEYGYTECLTGRRRHGPLSLNQVYNSPVQGTAAEVVMDAMARLSEIGNSELQPELNIHDDLTWMRVPIKRVDTLAERIIEEMLAVPFSWVNVPITVEMSVGPDWLNMEEVATYSSDEWNK